MRKSAVEFLLNEMFNNGGLKREQGVSFVSKDLVNQAKKIEKEEELKKQLFIGKVSDIIGFEKTVELLKQVNEEIK
jgi:hypothetical protein